ncbi:MAG: carboxymuconolactone decarboxylase family protein [Steroidobacteraceae bacterium]|nr:carboxymuconolactone decarboxylase family protein [Steroidobacteraceae bacterium]
MKTPATPYHERLSDVPVGWPTSEPPDTNAEGGVDRRARGLQTIHEITGATGESVVASVRELAPDLADWIVDFAYGDVASRQAIDKRTRQLAIIGGLTVLGHAQPQLKVHIQGALNVGCRPAEIVEVILQMSVFAGFPAALNALTTAREAFAE